MGNIISIFWYLFLAVVSCTILYFIIKFAVKSAIKEIKNEKDNDDNK